MSLISPNLPPAAPPSYAERFSTEYGERENRAHKITPSTQTEDLGAEKLQTANTGSTGRGNTQAVNSQRAPAQNAGLENSAPAETAANAAPDADAAPLPFPLLAEGRFPNHGDLFAMLFDIDGNNTINLEDFSQLSQRETTDLVKLYAATEMGNDNPGAIERMA